ncbi:MAG: aldo/keto reductase [Anaerolineales bacterium]|nr:aldo/keto reductase [Anaerolineales bacterium]
MEYRKLGRTDLKVSRLCLGTMQFGWTVDEAQAYKLLATAVARGVNFIDTADIYSRWVDGNPGGVSEQIIGRWLKQAGILREKLIIATKVRGPMGDPVTEGLSRERIVEMVENSLRRLQLDYLDLYQAHWPDDAVSIEETMRAFDDLVRAGKVRYVGASNYSGAQLRQALAVSDEFGLTRYESLQPHYNLVHREEFEDESAEICRENEVGVIPYSPLAGGFLTGKYRRDSEPDSVRAEGRRQYYTDKNWTLLAEMDELAARHEATVAQIALAWMLADPVITSPIIGANSPAQLEDSLGAVDVMLSDEEKARLDSLSA